MGESLSYRSEEEHKLVMMKEKCTGQIQQKKKERDAELGVFFIFFGKVLCIESSHFFYHLLQQLSAENEQKQQYFNNLKALSVDLDQIILSENPVPEKVIKVVATDNAANFHIHQSSS